MQVFLVRTAAFAAILVLLAALPACKRDAEQSAGSPQAQQDRSSLSTFADGITGKQAVRSGQKAQQQIRDVSQKQQQQLQSVLEE